MDFLTQIIILPSFTSTPFVFHPSSRKKFILRIISTDPRRDFYNIYYIIEVDDFLDRFGWLILWMIEWFLKFSTFPWK